MKEGSRRRRLYHANRMRELKTQETYPHEHLKKYVNVLVVNAVSKIEFLANLSINQESSQAIKK
jgi:hypothetical protein